MEKDNTYYNFNEYYNKVPAQFKDFIVYNDKYFYIVTYSMQNSVFYFFSVNAFPLATKLFHFNLYSIRAIDLVRKTHKSVAGCFPGCYYDIRYKCSSFFFIETVADMKAFPHLHDLQAKKDFFENVFYNPNFIFKFYREGSTTFPSFFP